MRSTTHADSSFLRSASSYPTRFALASAAATLALSLALASCGSDSAARDVNESADPAIPSRPLVIQAGKRIEDDPREVRLRNVRQLTFGGENAEAYWSNDGTKLVMQSRYDEDSGDQIFVLDLVTGEKRRISTGEARTTCAYFLQGDREIVFASTHGAGPQVPMVTREPGLGYVWGVFDDYDIWVADANGGNLRQITHEPGYDAEATVCPVTGTIVFTSTRDGDLELYSMEPDGSNVKRLTNRVGYDGGAFFSHDGSKLVQRSGFPANDEELKKYQRLLARGLVAPAKMEITVLDRDGSNFRQITNNGKANFAPFWHPDNERILFSSNINSTSPRRPNFDIFMVREDGTEMEQITFDPTFDAFPMFSPDGRFLVFASNRGADPGSTDTNVFVAEWVE